MKTSYKTSLFTLGTIAFSVVLMSSVVAEKTAVKNDTTLQQIAYKNLITYQEGEMYVYNMSALKENKVEQFRNVAVEALGSKELIPSTLKEAANYSAKDPSAYFEQDLKSGTLSFSKGLQGYYKAENLNLPEQSKALEISTAYLKEAGLAPEDSKELKMMHSGGMRTSDAGSEKITDVLRTITYGRMLNGIPVYGAGSKIVVNVGNNGEIVGINSRWKAVEKSNAKAVAKINFKDAKKAEAEMQRQLIVDYGKDANFKIDNMYLAYYDGGDNFIQPAYFFQVSVTLPEVKGSPSIKFDYIGIVPALNNPPEAIAALQQSAEGQKMIKKLSTEPKISNEKRSDAE